MVPLWLWRRLLDRVRADPGFAAGEGVRGAVKGFVVRVVGFAEGAEVLLAGPAVDGEVAARNVGVAQKLGSKIVRRGAEELGPGALRPVSGLKGGNLLLGNLELPYDDEHAFPDSVPVNMVAHSRGGKCGPSACAGISQEAFPSLISSENCFSVSASAPLAKAVNTVPVRGVR